MTPQTYIETDSDLQAAQIREWLGREYGRSVNIEAYPIPPDSWPGMHNTPPTEPPPYSFTLYYIDPIAKAGGGGVFELDDDILAFATGEQILSNGLTFSYDIATNQKTLEQLTAAGQAAVSPS